MRIDKRGVLRGSSILFVSPCHFDHLRQRHHAFAEGFARAGAKVLFLNPFKSGWLGLRQHSTNVPDLTSIELSLPFRATGQPLLHRLSCRIAQNILRRHCFWSPSSTILWVAEPSIASWVAFPWKGIFYDRCDRHGHFPGQKLEPWQFYENLLFQHSQTVFCSSQVIQMDVPTCFQEKVTLLPNAGSSPKPVFRSATNPSSTDTENRPAPPWRAISAGAHFEWTNWSWLQLLADNPLLQVELAGPGRGSGFRKLLDHPRLRYHGVLDHDSLQQLLRNCHVGLVPFADTPLTNGVDPIKAYEYAAAGLRIWTPPLPSLFSNPLVDSFVSDISELTQAVKTLSTTPIFKIIPTWHDRLDQIFSNIPGKLSGDVS